MIGRILFILLVFVSGASAGDVFFETDIITIPLPVNNIGGFETITPHMHYYDSYFCLYNDGGISYMIYQHDYIGEKEICINGCNLTYKNSFIGSILPNQMIMLNNNASYYIYADYKDVMDFGSKDIIEKKFNQWWVIVVIIIIFLIGIVKIYKVIR